MKHVLANTRTQPIAIPFEPPVTIVILPSNKSWLPRFGKRFPRVIFGDRRREAALGHRAC